MTISVSLDRDLEVKVQKFAEGIGVDVSDLIERAIVYALSSRYPDQGLPSGGAGRPDNSLPGDQPEIGNELPSPPFDGTVDNELPEGEPSTDPDFGIDEDRGQRPSQGEGFNPDLDPNVDPNVQRQTSDKPQPKK